MVDSWCGPQALAGEVGMSNELDDVAKSLFVGNIPNIWRKLAPDTLKSLGNWMLYFMRRFSQYTTWVSGGQAEPWPVPRAPIYSNPLDDTPLLPLSLAPSNVMDMGSPVTKVSFSVPGAPPQTFPAQVPAPRAWL